MTADTDRWRRKVAAYLHDPPEKALIMKRVGHEQGTVKAMFKRLFGTSTIPDDLEATVERADWWAAAADRAQWPRALKDAVVWANEPELVHPLSGARYVLRGQVELTAKDVVAVGAMHTNDVVERVLGDSGEIREDDWKRLALALWRLLPEPPPHDDRAAKFGELWTLLPADTRVPDHSIFEHLRLASAFAGAGDDPALMLVSLGPVQSFIAQARSTSDLWAGSHLLSRLAWEALKLVCEELGPDAVVFPDLWRLPQCDAWLEHGPAKLKIPDEYLPPVKSPVFTDSHPLFFASLPNRFVAIVPSAEVDSLAEQLGGCVRDWALNQANAGWNELLNAADIKADDSLREYAYRQIDAQLAGFPEVHWAAVRIGEKPDDLRAALAQFCDGGERPGWFGTVAGGLVLAGKDVKVDGEPFFAPNEGARYPAAYDLLERAGAVIKATRTVEALTQQGDRCSVCGEREFLAFNKEARKHNRSDGRSDLWQRIAERQPSLARPGERLCAVCALKRAWPRLARNEIETTLQKLGKDADGEPVPDRHMRRYVVSTHTMALAPALDRMIDRIRAGDTVGLDGLKSSLPEHLRPGQRGVRPSALPRRLASRLSELRTQHATEADVIRALPGALDALREAIHGSETGADDADERDARNRAARDLADLERAVKDAAGQAPDSYYALVLMDGDRMGAWLAADADGPVGRPPLRDRFHSTFERAADEIAQRGEGLERLFRERPGPSPAYHGAVSRALNAFSLHAVPFVVERLFHGKVLYAGGDDVLAMVGVRDLLGVMQLLRCAYSGIEPPADPAGAWREAWLDDRAKEFARRRRFDLRNDHMRLSLRTGSGERLHRMLGHKATASMGVVIAHHMDPLGAVLRELREAEKRAKAAGRDAFSIALAKRSGGTSRFTCGWHVGAGGDGAYRSALDVLRDLRQAFAGSTSRGAAYAAPAWTDPLVGSARLDDGELIARIAEPTRYILRRQSRDGTDRSAAPRRADSLAKLTARERARRNDSGRRGRFDAGAFVRDALGVAEFLARAARRPREAGKSKPAADGAVVDRQEASR
ncbi:MAG: type III-B CRISPR-associated protein Cas10/Cmr2 [Deltaproteobacteria bacterium]|nr:MAG: type III-B CRISPR-associated protein Cas10/Cmr2 [Deltaproteobacteria bacterium]